MKLNDTFITSVICLWIALSVWNVIPARAQDNAYGIDNLSYALYLRASKLRYKPEGLLVADSLYQRGVELNEGKSQCLALTIPLLYYFAQPDCFKQVDEAVARLKKKARETGLPQYYYYALSNRVNYYMNQQRTLSALDIAEEMRKEAFAENHPYGIFASIRLLGNISLSRRNPKAAHDYYVEAYEYGVVHCKDQDMSGVCNRIVLCCTQMNRFDEALEYARKAESLAVTPQARLSSKAQLAGIYYNMGRHDEFLKCLRECEEMERKEAEFDLIVYRRLRLYRCLVQHNYEQAYRYADSLNVEEDRLAYRMKVARAQGDYERAFRCSEQLAKLRDSLNLGVQQSDFAELNSRMGVEVLRMEAKDLQLQNAHLNLRNTRITMVVALLVVFILIIYSVSRYRSMRLLRTKNRELDEARARAEQADRMKTVFLQNMSHEIRTPLNAIVGFSQVLCDADTYGLSEEEKVDVNRRIASNSELLTTLINDILDLSSLESGHYSMNVTPTVCNEMARSALDTVHHRQPEGVRLYFTTEVDDKFIIATDGKRLQQVLINFLTNAQKNTVRGEIHLHCSLKEVPGNVTFSVTDTGTGVPPDKREVIFERFRKLDDFKQGTGLGLNICREIGERLGGKVYLDTQYADGARFVITVPATVTPGGYGDKFKIES